MRRDKETTKEEVKRIVDKYNESFSELSNNGTALKWEVFWFELIQSRALKNLINVI